MDTAKFDCTLLQILDASMWYSVRKVTYSRHLAVAAEICVMVSAEHGGFQVDSCVD